jgi:hypothetical protein
MRVKLLFSFLIFFAAACQNSTEPASPDEKMQSVFHDLTERTLYLGASAALGSISCLAKVGWGVCQLSPWAETTGRECLLLGNLCSSIAGRAFACAFKGVQGVTPPYRSWYLNQALLSQVPAETGEEKKLLSFLEKRWLAKSTGYYSVLTNWMCPCFGIGVQVHPESTNSYARDPSNKISQTYAKRLEDWKRSLPHPMSYPLILTRPFDCREYLPANIEVVQGEHIERTFEKVQKEKGAILDVTSLFSAWPQEKWLETWVNYSRAFSQLCQERKIDENQIVCIQRVNQEGIGGIRILPLATHSASVAEEHHQFLLLWISKFGLSANRVELDRGLPPSGLKCSGAGITTCPKEEFLAYLDAMDLGIHARPSEQALMIQGAFQVLKGLFAHVTEEKWNAALQSPAQASVIQLSFSKIKENFELLTKEFSFYGVTSRIEQIQADLTALLEIFSPFSSGDFPAIYSTFFTSAPEALLPMAKAAIHSTGMTSLAGILKAVQNTIGYPPRVLFGENTYFEVIRALELASDPISTEDIKEEDWKEIDLLVAQFNPVLKRIELEVNEYKVENVEETVQRVLDARQGNSFTLALDCTLDFLNSPRVTEVLTRFQKEIESGALNVICYRSGIKFDLFGLDNYCGAPFYMIHNEDEKWASFDALLTDPALQTDLLSLNWFCLAYKHAAPQLEQYRKHVFDNTKALLDKVPKRLFSNSASYRIIPMREGVDPAFVDIKIFGALHKLRGSLVGGALMVKCLEAKHPLFFRPSLGFSHPNLSILFTEECATIRLTVGLDPSQVGVLVDCFAAIDALNGS